MSKFEGTVETGAWAKKTIPEEKYTIVSGHTHISDHFNSDGKCLYNLGSWLEEPGHEKPNSVVLLIDNLGKCSMLKI